MVMKAFREGAAGGVMKFILFGLMTMAVGGLVLMDIGGFFRGGGIGGHDAVKVGNERVSIQTFDRILRRNIAQMNITPQQAYQMGLADRILASEAQAMVMARAANEHGIKASNNFIANQVSQIVMPMVQPGQNPRDVLSQLLRNQGMSETEFIDAIGKQTEAELLVTALQSGFLTEQSDVIRDLYAFQKETRSVEYIAFPNEAVDTPEPTDKQIEQLYELRKKGFAEPEMRTFKIIRIRDETLKNSLDISDEAALDTYESNIDFYKTEEQRIFEQTIVNSEDKAKNIAKNAVSSDLKSAVKKETGKISDYLGEENFADAKLLPELKEKIGGAKAGEVIGPVKSPLGWHVIKIKKISPANVRPFEQVKKEIVADLQESQVAEERYNLVNTVEDMLASGASLDEIDKEIPLDVTTLPPINRAGQDVKGNDVLDSYKDFKTTLLETGFGLEQGASSSMMEMPDGRFIGIYLETLKAETYKPLESVSESLKKDWLENQRKLQNRAQAVALMEELKKKDFKDLAKEKNKTVQMISGITRTEKRKPLSKSALEQIFQAALNQPFSIDIDGGVAIAQVVAVNIPQTADTSSKQYGDLEKDLENNAQTEALLTFINEKQKDYGVKINRKLLERAYDAAGAATN